MTEHKLWFIWKNINVLQDYLRNQLEASSNPSKTSLKDFDNASKAKKFIQEERCKLKKKNK